MCQDSQSLHIKMAEMGPDSSNTNTWGLAAHSRGEAGALSGYLVYMVKCSPIVWVLHSNSASSQRPLSD